MRIFVTTAGRKKKRNISSSEIEKNMLKKTYDPMSIQTFHMSGKY